MDKKAYEYSATAGVLQSLASDISAWATGKGFWNIPDAISKAMLGDPVVDKYVTDLIKTQKAALITTETSELVEGIRKPAPSGVEGFTNEEEEQADQLIRILDYCGKFNLRIGECVCAKMAVNEGRPYQHGKAF